MGKRGILHPPDLCHVQASNPAQAGAVSPAAGLSHLQTIPVSPGSRGPWRNELSRQLALREGNV